MGALRSHRTLKVSSSREVAKEEGKNYREEDDHIHNYVACYGGMLDDGPGSLARDVLLRFRWYALENGKK